MPSPSSRWTIRVTRNSILFVVGLAGVAHETLVNDSDRPTLLLLFAAMIGLPAFLTRDERPSSPEKTPSLGSSDSPGDPP